MPTYYCIFPHDNNVKVIIPEHQYSDMFSTRGYHEPEFRKIHTYMINNKIIDTEKNFIDLGAWIGDNTLPWAKNIKGTIYAIDPSVANCEFIYFMKELNELKNIEIIPLAISETERIVSTNDELFHCSFAGKDEGKYKLNSYSLDFLMGQGILKNIGYIHLDVEGYEYNVIKGAKQLIDLYRPIITFEQHLETDDIAGICQLVKEKMYTIYLINEILPGCRPDCRNYLAFPSEMNLDFIQRDLDAYPSLKLLEIVNPLPQS